MRRLVLAATAAAIVSGCARDLSPEQCAAGDWRAIGLADGSAGFGPERFETRRIACVDAGSPPGPEAAAEWAAGRAAGLEAYCTPRNAYRIGLSGRALAQTCPPEDLPELNAVNEAGWRDGVELRAPYYAYPAFGFPYHGGFGRRGWGYPGWGYPGWGPAWPGPYRSPYANPAR